MLSDDVATNKKRSLSSETRDMRAGTWGCPPQSAPTKRSRRSQEERRPEDAAGPADAEVNNQVSIELPKMDCFTASAADGGV